jgi:hypothetical protein
MLLMLMVVPLRMVLKGDLPRHLAIGGAEIVGLFRRGPACGRPALAGGDAHPRMLMGLGAT